MSTVEKSLYFQNIQEKNLVKAVEESNIEVASEILESGSVSPDLKSEDGFPIMVIAAKNNDPEMVNTLLKYNADTSITDSYGRCALVWGIMNKNPKLYVPLLEKHKDINIPNNLLVFAIAYGELKLAEYILSVINNVDTGWVAGKNPLMWAVDLDNPKLISAILMRGPTITDLSITDNENMGDPKLERFMMELVKGDTPDVKHCKETKFTKKMGIYKHCENNKMICAYKSMFDTLATRDYSVETIQDCITNILESELNVDIRNTAGRTPLAMFCLNERGEFYFQDDKKIADIFLSAGANINTVDKDLNTPLHHAVSEQYINMVNILLERGADPLLRNRYGYSPRELAALIYPYNRDIVKIIDNTIKK